MNSRLQFSLFIIVFCPLSLGAKTGINAQNDSAEEKTAQLYNAIANFSPDNQESIQNIADLVAQDTLAPKGQQRIEVSPSFISRPYQTTVYSGAGLNTFLKGFAIYRTMEDQEQPNTMLKKRDLQFGNMEDKSSFENQGKALIKNLHLQKSPNDAFSQVILPDYNRILAAGVADEYKLVFASFTMDGNQDSSFGSFGGFSIVPLGTGIPSWGTRYINAYGIIKQPNDNFVVYGRLSEGSGNHLFLIQFNPNGIMNGQPVIIRNAPLKG